MRIPRLVVLEALRALGVPGLAGALLSGFAMLWGMLVVLPAADEHERALVARARAEARLAASERGEAAKDGLPVQAVQDLRAGLTAQPEATSDIDRLYAAAEAENLSLGRGEYSLAIDPESGVGRYQILLPLRGDYRQLRRFLAAALASVPALGLEELELERKQVADSELEGRVRLTLYLSRR